MTWTGVDVARALEQAEALQLRRQAEAWTAAPGRAGRAVDVCGGVAAFTDPAFGRKLNHVAGSGMSEPFTAQALDRLEAECAAFGVAVEIDLCPHADAGAIGLLGARGYVVNAFSNTYVMPLDEGGAAVPPPSDVEVLRDRAAVEPLFVAASVAGFAVQAQSRPVALLEALARIALGRADTQLFVARFRGEVAGSAGMSVLETAGGRIAFLGIASTLPAHRGRGVQSALLRARVEAARRAGCAMAQVGARPANVSARNVERAGFRLAYTKPTFVKSTFAKQVVPAA